MNSRAANVRGRNAGRGRDGRLNLALAQIGNILVDEVGLARTRLDGQKYVGPGFEDIKRLCLSHKVSIPLLRIRKPRGFRSYFLLIKFTINLMIVSFCSR